MANDTAQDDKPATMTTGERLAAQQAAKAAKKAAKKGRDAELVEEKALEPINTLSRGFKQRVGVAQAILHEPKFLILDEPTNGLDPSQTQHMRELIQRLAQDATVILSTHIMQEVDAICDRALILLGGELVLDERLQDLKQSNQLRLRCGGDSSRESARAPRDPARRAPPARRCRAAAARW